MNKVFKYHVSGTGGKISVKIKVGITFIFRFHRRLIQLIVFVQLQRSTAQAGRQNKLRHPTRFAEDVVRTTKGLQERTQLTEWDDGET